MKSKLIYIIALSLTLFFLVPQSRSYILFNLFKLDSFASNFNVGKIELYKNSINFNKDISIWGYLIKRNNRYFLVSNESFAKVKYLYRPKETVIYLDDININEECVNEYVESTGRLNILAKNQIALLYSQNLAYMSTISAKHVNGESIYGIRCLILSQ